MDDFSAGAGAVDRKGLGPRRWAFVRQVAGVAALWLAAVAGCESPALEPEVVARAAPSPQKQLELAMRRLEESLKHARAAAGAGVVSERNMAYELIEPTPDDDRYTARVVIQTSVALKAKITPIGEDPEDGAGFKQVDKRMFALVYKNERWELVDPPMDELTELEKTYFQNALSDG